jgi:hypothetical protein
LSWTMSSALRSASEELKNDRSVVLAAVTRQGYALEFASEELKKDPEVVLASTGFHFYALKYASEELKKDRSVMLAAVRIDGWALEYASEELRKDREVVLAAVKHCCCGIGFASEGLREDAFLKEWASLSEEGRRNRRAREAFLRKHGERNAKLKAQVDLWLIRHGQVDALSAKRQRVSYM